MPEGTADDDRALLERAEATVMVLAPDLTVRDLNEAAERIHGVSREEVRGRSYLATFVPEPARDAVRATLERVRDGGESVGFETPLSSRGGGSRRILWRASRIPAEGEPRILAVGLEITDRVRVEGEHRRQSAWLRGLIQTTQDALVTIDRESRIVLFNPAAQRIFGYAPEEVIGEDVSVLMPPPYRSEHAGYVERYERTGEARAIGRIRVVEALRKSGERFPIELSVAAVEVDGETRYGAFIRDISEKVRLQEELIDQRRLAAVGQTSATLAHEIGNPLNNMVLTAKVLERRLKKLGVEDERAHGSLASITEEIRRLNDLLDEFRSLAKRQRLEMRPLDLRSMIDRVCQEHRASLTIHGVTIAHRIPEALPTIHADQGKLKQVLLNLCKNAVEAMPEGGGIEVTCRTDPEEAVIEITDTGPGIPEGLDVFEPFKTTKDQGTGLGLAIAKRIVGGHGGSITHRPASGGGTTFEIRLPLEPPTVPTQ